MGDPKAECEAILNMLQPFAVQQLERYGQFFPFGGTMSAGGEVALAAGWTGGEQPEPTQVVDMLKKGFREGAQSGAYRATAVVYDALVVPPGRVTKQDAIAVALDHRGSYSVVVFFSYSIDRSKGVVVEAPFVVAGAGDIFSQ